MHVFDANGEDPDETPQDAASDLGIHSLPMSLYGTLGINVLIPQFKFNGRKTDPKTDLIVHANCFNPKEMICQIIVE